jgi:formylglycine-generating enzyme required for sulfatase activity
MIRNFILFVIGAIAFFLWAISPTINHNALAATITCPENMALIQGGTFRMGSDDHYEDEKSADKVTVTDFCIDRHEVTNAQFAKFVAETGYKTIAERPLSVEEFPTLKPEQRKPGSLVFIPPEKGKTQVETLSWWHWVQGADWQHPQGQNSSIVGKENYPVVQIAFEDAQAYAKWAGKSLPSEAQWEYAARGSLSKMIYSWGNQYSAKKANTWQGQFPFFNTEEDGFTGLAPVGSFRRYRPAAREAEEPNTGTSHIGFRLAKNLPV